MRLPPLRELNLGLDQARSHGHRDHRGAWSTGATQRSGPSTVVSGFDNGTGNVLAKLPDLDPRHHQSSMYPTSRQSFSSGSIQEPDSASWGPVATARRPEDKVIQDSSPLSSCGSQVRSADTTSSRSSSTSRAPEPRKSRRSSSVRTLPLTTAHQSSYQRPPSRKPSTSKEHQMREAHKHSEQRRRDQNKALMYELKCAVPQPGHENIKSKTNVGDIAKNEVVNNTLAYIRALLDVLVASHGERTTLVDAIVELLKESELRREESGERDDGKMNLTEWINGRHPSLLSLLPKSTVKKHDMKFHLQELQSFGPPNAQFSGLAIPRTEATEFEFPPNLKNFLEAHNPEERAVLGGQNGVLTHWEDICKARESSPMERVMMETED